jgi:hypothetical protein
MAKYPPSPMKRLIDFRIRGGRKSHRFGCYLKSYGQSGNVQCSDKRPAHKLQDVGQENRHPQNALTSPLAMNGASDTNHTILTNEKFCGCSDLVLGNKRDEISARALGCSLLDSGFLQLQGGQVLSTGMMFRLWNGSLT